MKFNKKQHSLKKHQKNHNDKQNQTAIDQVKDNNQENSTKLQAVQSGQSSDQKLKKQDPEVKSENDEQKVNESKVESKSDPQDAKIETVTTQDKVEKEDPIVLEPIMKNEQFNEKPTEQLNDNNQGEDLLTKIVNQSKQSLNNDKEAQQQQQQKLVTDEFTASNYDEQMQLKSPQQVQSISPNQSFNFEKSSVQAESPSESKQLQVEPSMIQTLFSKVVDFWHSMFGEDKLIHKKEVLESRYKSTEEQNGNNNVLYTAPDRFTRSYLKAPEPEVLPNPDAKVFILNKVKQADSDPYLNVQNPLGTQREEKTWDKTVTLYNQ